MIRVTTTSSTYYTSVRNISIISIIINRLDIIGKSSLINDVIHPNRKSGTTKMSAHMHATGNNVDIGR